MVIDRGGIYWADLGAPDGSRPAMRRPVVVISADTYNRSRLATVVALVITSNTDLATMPGNVFLPAVDTGLPRDSVANVTAVVTLDKDRHRRAGWGRTARADAGDRSRTAGFARPLVG